MLIPPFANRWLNWAILWEIVLLVEVVHVPSLHEPFGTFSLPLVDWAFVSVQVCNSHGCPTMGEKYVSRRLAWATIRKSVV